MQNKLIPIFITFLLATLTAVPAMADSASEAAERIKQRLVQVDEMKAAGEVGEDAAGYLSERTALAGRKASVVASENADRRVIYEAVAQRTGQTVDEVGEQRALQIAQRSRSGVWLEKPSGGWYQKP